jgi:hypothetical protein
MGVEAEGGMKELNTNFLLCLWQQGGRGDYRKKNTVAGSVVPCFQGRRRLVGLSMMKTK